MGKINIIGGSPLKMEFLNTVGGPAGDSQVDLKKRGNTYHMELPFQTASGDAANMRVTGVGKQKVVVDYD